MNDLDFYQINKLSRLHDGTKIFFCKTDYLEMDFTTIAKLKNNVILISGNSDYAITPEIVKRCPDNVKYWFCQNAISKSEIIYPIPIGLENKERSIRDGHGIAYPDRVVEKENILFSLPQKDSCKFIYANFNVQTNIEHREKVKRYALNEPHIDWQEPELNINDLYNKYLDYKMILCPVGNGIDTHRLWEVLYCNRIPITVIVGDYKIYDLYKKLPIILLDSLDKLSDQYHILDQYNQVINRTYDFSLLRTDYWINTINGCLSYL